MCSIMEDGNNENLTFVELQTIKKDYDEVIGETVDQSNGNITLNDIPTLLTNGCGDLENEGNLYDDDDDDGGSESSASAPPAVQRMPKPKKKIKKSKLEAKMNKGRKKLGAAFSKKGNKKKLNNKKKRKPRTKAKDPKQPKGEKPKCEYPRLCVGCGHAYRTKQSFWNHKQRCAMLPENRMRGSVDENGLPIGGVTGGFKRRKEYICAHCERRYRKKYNLQEHLKKTCRGKPCNKGRLQCWETGCQQAFYKYVDLIQHLTLQHGQDLQVQKLQFPNFTAFNTWKTEESNSKFMYARKITGSKRFSNTKYHYFVCQFNHRNEKKNNNRKTNRRKNDSLVVPNYNCPSRIMVKECENQILVTYISSHNHELNLSNVKYQPLEKETRAYIKTLLQLGVSAQKIKEHLQEGVGNPEIDSFLTTKQHFLTLNRIKRMESKLKAKNRARQLELATPEKDNGNVSLENGTIVVTQAEPFTVCEKIMMDPMGTSASYSCTPPPSKPTATPRKEPDEKVRSIETNLKKLKGYMHKSNVKEKLSERISKLIQELCDECENVETVSTTDRPAVPKKPRASNTNRKRKTAVVTPAPVTMVTPLIMSSQMQPQEIQPVMIQHPIQMQTHQLQPLQPMETLDQTRIVNAVINNIVIRDEVVMNEKSFTPAIDETMDLLKPHFQPFNVNLLCLKSIDSYIPEREQLLLKRVDERFTVGWLCDSIVNSFLNLICHPLGNVVAADTSISDYVTIHQKVPDVWHCFNWSEIDTIFIPCNPSKKNWFLLVLLVKQSELQVLDPTSSFESISNIYKKYANSINCWYNVLRNFLGIMQCNVTSPPHTTHNDQSSTGVLVCWYVFQCINKRSFVDNVDLDVFRQYMYNTIVSNSSTG